MTWRKMSDKSSAGSREIATCEFWRYLNRFVSPTSEDVRSIWRGSISLDGSLVLQPGLSLGERDDREGY